MAIQFKCESCGKSLKADDTKAGKRVKCPGCSEVLTIPDAQPEVEDFQNYQADDDDNDEDDENPFTAPKQDMANRSRSRRGSSHERTLADPGKRFLGALLDSVVAMAGMVPGFAMFGIGLANQQPNGDPEPTMTIIGVLLIMLGLLVVGGFNLYLMAARSQSIAKYLLKMQVMNFDTDEPAGFVKTFLLRNFVNGLIGAVPMVGGIYSIVDVLFIFGDEHRCLHDKLAGTYVANI